MRFEVHGSQGFYFQIFIWTLVKKYLKVPIITNSHSCFQAFSSSVSTGPILSCLSLPFPFTPYSSIFFFFFPYQDRQVTKTQSREHLFCSLWNSFYSVTGAFCRHSSSRFMVWHSFSPSNSWWEIFMSPLPCLFPDRSTPKWLQVRHQQKMMDFLSLSRFFACIILAEYSWLNKILPFLLFLQSKSAKNPKNQERSIC